MPTSRERELQAVIATLRASEARYRSLFQSIDTGYGLIEVVFDRHDQPVDYVLLEVNPAFLQQTGLPDVTGKPVRSLLPEHEPLWLETYGRVARTGKAERFEHRVAAGDRWYGVVAFPIGAAGRHQVAVVLEDISERKRAEQRRLDSEDDQTFLLTLSDTLRPLDDPAAIREQACRLLGQHLKADRAYFVDYEVEKGFGIVVNDYAAEGVDSVAGRYPFEAFRTTYDRVASGGTWVVEDAAGNTEIAPAERDFFLSRQVVAWVDVPLVKAGRLLAILCVVQTQPHTWGSREIDLVEQTAERLWAAVARARAEAGLRESEERLRIALEAGRMGTYRLDLATGEQQWSDGQYEIFGLTRGVDAPSRELFLSLVHPDDHHRIAFTAEDIRTPGTYLDSEFRIIRPDGELRWIIAHALAVFGPDGRPAELIGVNQDVTEQRRLAAAMHSSEERLNEFSEASSDILWIRRASDYQWEYLSPAFHRIYGISRLDAMRGDNYRSWADLILPEDRARALASIERVMQGERVAFEYRIRRPEDGEIRWLRNTDFPMRDGSDEVVRIGGIGQDITAAKRAEEHQRLLQHELQHRVRNTLAVIRSITRRTAATTESKDEFFMHLDGRIDSFARVQAAVTRDPTGGVDLAFLVAEELRVVGAQEGPALTIDGPPVALRSNAAETIGLAIHELTTNAMKHGALARPQGRIEVSWLLRDGELQFDWIESGLKNLPPRPARSGFGTEILEQTLAYEFGARSTLDYRPTGLNCRIMLPLSQTVEDRPQGDGRHGDM